MCHLLQERGLDAARKMLKEAGQSGDKTEVETQLKKVLNNFLDDLTRYIYSGKTILSIDITITVPVCQSPCSFIMCSKYKVVHTVVLSIIIKG